MRLMPTVADLLVASLRRAGVPRVFGVPGGGSNLELLEAARVQGLPFVLAHQEWAACIMAAVTGELSGHPGAAISTLGPGVTASATGLAHARLDRAPMLYVSDRHPEAALAFTTHQAIDHRAHVGAIVKGTVTVTPDSASHWIAHAVQLALSEPRGPVHLDLPADVAGRDAVPMAVNVTPPPPARPAADALERAAALIRGARRPVVLAGLGCRLADAKWLRAFCEALPAPLLTTYKAKGALPDPHPLAMGVFTGGALEEPFVRQADLIIAFGLDPVELIPRAWPYQAPVLNLTRCPSDSPGLVAPGGGAYYKPAGEVMGDLGGILEELAPRLASAVAADWDVAAVDRWRRERRAALEVPVAGLAPHRVAQLAREFLPAGAIATVDAGAHMFPVTAYWDALEPGECLISNGLATMGFALPAAIAAQLQHPDRRVVCFTGDGGLMMVAAELETVARLGLPIVIIVFDDQALSLIEVKQEQRGIVGASMRYAGPDFPALARAFGLRAWIAKDEETFRNALVAAQAAPGPTLIDARIDASGYRRTLEIVRGIPSPHQAPSPHSIPRTGERAG
jgi:acetolactate synthase-1/2/3 large subunit